MDGLPTHRLVALDRPGARIRRARCACGSLADVAEDHWQHARDWMRLHRIDPAWPAGALATLANGGDVPAELRAGNAA